MFDKWPFGQGRSPKQTKEDPLIRIEVPGFRLEISRDEVKTIAALWPLLLRGGRQTFPWIMTLWFLLMNGIGMTVPESLCNQPLHDVTPIVAEDDRPQQQELDR